MENENNNLFFIRPSKTKEKRNFLSERIDNIQSSEFAMQNLKNNLRDIVNTSSRGNNMDISDNPPQDSTLNNVVSMQDYRLKHNKFDSKTRKIMNITNEITNVVNKALADNQIKAVEVAFCMSHVMGSLLVTADKEEQVPTISILLNKIYEVYKGTGGKG